jgi:hypothetical protein
MKGSRVGYGGAGMFERHRAEKAAKAYQGDLARWKQERDGCAELLEVARGYHGSPCGEIMLGVGEAVFYQVAGAALIEERRGQGHYEGRSAGVSVPVGSIAGRPVRYRAGASRGHFVQGAPSPAAVDTGTVFVTSKRVIFQGARQTRECAFAKLIGFRHSDTEGSTTFSVSNRQKPTTIGYGPALSGAFDFRLDLALAHFRGTVGDLAGQLQAELVRLDAERPAAPAGAQG